MINYSYLLESVWHPPLAFEEVASPELPPEIELQALWYAGAFGHEFRLSDQRTCRIVQWGEWNLGAGPDFSRVCIEIDGKKFRGDLELDTRPSDWEHHGHGTNPTFNNTVLHVSFQQPRQDTFIRTYQQRLVPALHITHDQIAEACNLPKKKTAISVPGNCVAPLRQISSAALDRLLEEAALRRASLKASRFLRTELAHGLDHTLFQAVAETLGYSGNTLPMRILAQRCHVEKLLDESQVQRRSFSERPDFSIRSSINRHPLPLENTSKIYGSSGGNIGRIRKAQTSRRCRGDLVANVQQTILTAGSGRFLFS